MAALERRNSLEGWVECFLGTKLREAAPVEVAVRVVVPAVVEVAAPVEVVVPVVVSVLRHASGSGAMTSPLVLSSSSSPLSPQPVTKIGKYQNSQTTNCDY